MSVWLILLTDPSLALPPVDPCPGTNPRQAAKLRPLSIVSGSGTNAATAPAVKRKAASARGVLIDLPGFDAGKRIKAEIVKRGDVGKRGVLP